MSWSATLLFLTSWLLVALDTGEKTLAEMPRGQLRLDNCEVNKIDYSPSRIGVLDVAKIFSGHRNRVFGVSSPSVSYVAKADQERAYATLVSALTDDPVERWLWPELAHYNAVFPEFLAAMGGKAFDEGTVWKLDDFVAVAFWYPPGTVADGDAIVNVLTDSVAADKLDETMSVVDQMDKAHPTHPHWYLPWFGVHRAQQGRGLGSQLMPRCLEVVDAAHLPAYLETSNPRNVTFYERHGYEVVGEARAGRCPPILFMSRSAR